MVIRLGSWTAAQALFLSARLSDLHCFNSPFKIPTALVVSSTSFVLIGGGAVVIVVSGRRAAVLAGAGGLAGLM